MKLERIEDANKAMLVLRSGTPVPPWLTSIDDTGVRVLRVGPARWLFVFASDAEARRLTAQWRRNLAAVTHLLEDATDRFVTFRITGDGAKSLLDEQTRAAISGTSQGIRTLLGDAPVIVDVHDADHVDVLTDRSYAHYAYEWIRQATAAE